jgi:Flp pilus assembly protein TadG
MKLRYRPFPLNRFAIPPLLRRLIKAREGIETVEFALVSITLFLFLLGVVEFGWLYWTQSGLQYAAEAGHGAQRSTAAPAGRRRAAGTLATRGFRALLPASCSECPSRAPAWQISR